MYVIKALCHHPTRWARNTLQAGDTLVVFQLSQSHTVGLEQQGLASFMLVEILSPSHTVGLEHNLYDVFYENTMSPSHTVGLEQATAKLTVPMIARVAIPHGGLRTFSCWTS